MSISSRLNPIINGLPENVRLVAVSKFHAVSTIQEAYNAGQRIFGESRVQELVLKQQQLPDDIEWHFIGHLQTNKVKQIAPFIHTIHAVDSLRLMKEVNKEAVNFNRKIHVLLQIHIAQEEDKFGFSFDEIEELGKGKEFDSFPNLIFSGLMGMATFTDDEKQIRNEFKLLNTIFQKLKKDYFSANNDFKELSMGMSDDYPIAIEEGSTLIRVGSKIFGNRI